MGYIDLIIAGMLFLAAVSIVFVGVGQFLPEKVSISESAYRDVFADLTEQVNQKVLTMTSDCNSSFYACDFFYPAQLVADKNTLLSFNPFAVSGSKAVVVARPSQELEVYSLDHNNIAPDYNRAGIDMNFWNDQNNYFFKTPSLDINASDNNVFMDFLDGSGVEARIYLPQ